MKIGDKLYCYNRGDKVLCKKRLGGFFIKNTWWFTIGKYYIIDNISSSVTGEVEFSIKDNYDDTFKFNNSIFKKHFYTKKEYRKLKLNKINESRR